MMISNTPSRPPIWFAWVVLLAATTVCTAQVNDEPERDRALPDRQTTLYETWQTFTTDDGLPHDRIRAIHVSGERVWVGTDGGLARRDGDTWKSWTRREGLPWPAISAITEDERTQELWLGTWGGGLVRFSGGRFDTFDQRNSGLAGDLVFAVVVKDGRVWAATNGGLSSFDPIADRWELHFEQRADQPQAAITTLCLDPTGADCLYAGEWCGRVWQLDRGQDTWRQVQGPKRQGGPDPTSHPGPDNATLAVAAGGRSVWWLTLDRLLRRERLGDWEVQFAGQQMTRDELVNCLAVRNESEVWLGTEAGVRVLVDRATGTWVTYARPQRGTGGVVTISRQGQVLGSLSLASCFPSNRARCIAFQGDDVWIGTAAGLALGAGRTEWGNLRSTDRVESAETTTPAPGATPESTARPAAKRASEERSPIPIAVISPMAKLISLPGAGSPSAEPRTFADRFVALLVVKQANERAGYRDEDPFLLVAYPRGYDRYGWGMLEDGFPSQVYEDGVLGFVGHLGPDSRIISISALYTEAPVVNAAGTRATIDELINPWVFRCRAIDPHQHELLLDYVVDHLGCKRVAVLRSQGGLAQLHLDWWSRHAHRRGQPPVADLYFNPSARNLKPQLRALRQARPDVVLSWCDARTSAGMLRLLREAKMTPLFVGSDQIVNDEFVELAGEYPGVVLAIYPCNHRRDREAAAEFAEAYLRRHSSVRAERYLPPEAHFSFEATKHLMEAIKVGGRDRQAIRQALIMMSDAAVARLEKGEWKQYTWSALGIRLPGRAVRRPGGSINSTVPRAINHPG